MAVPRFAGKRPDRVPGAALGNPVRNSDPAKQIHQGPIIHSARTLRDLRADHALQGVAAGQHRTEESWFVANGQQQGGKVLHVQRVQQIGFVFHIDPEEPCLREIGLRLLEAGAVVAAHTAPLGAQADNEQGWGWRGLVGVHDVIIQQFYILMQSNKMTIKLFAI